MAKKFNAWIDDDRAKAFKIALIENDEKFTRWLERKIDEYLKERKAAKRAGKGETK